MDYREEFYSFLKEEKKLKENSISSYRHDVEAFLAETGDEASVTTTAVMAYIWKLQKENRKSSTITRNLISLRSFFTFLYVNDYIKENPMRRITLPKNEPHTPSVLSVEEIDLLLSQPDCSTQKGIRDRALLEFLYSGGMRVSEMIRVKLTDIHFDLGYVECIGENGHARAIPLGKTCAEYLKEYIEKARNYIIKGNETDVLFVNMRGEAMSRQGCFKIIRDYKEKSGISKEVNPHTLRHSFAAHLVANGADLKSVSMMLGHSDISSAQIYLQFAQNKLKDTYEKAHPHA
jgi:integrase/recombinase XerD